MKTTLLTLLFASFMLLGLNSCTKEYITQENYTLVPSITMVYERSASQWTVASDNNSASLTLNVPELTKYYMDQGIVSVAMSNNNEASFQTIPATILGVSYSYDYSLGKIIIYLEDPILDNGVTVPVPQNLVIKVSLSEADFVD